MGRRLRKLHGWKRWNAFLAAFAVVFLMQPYYAQLAAADIPTATDSSAPADAPPEKIKAALMRYDDETFIALLNENPEVVNLVYPNGRTLLNNAAYMGNLFAVEALTRQGANPNLGGKPPLMEAFYGASTDADLRSHLMPEHAKAPDIPRSTFYEIIATLVKAGANYHFFTMTKSSFTVNSRPFEPPSFVEHLIMEVCNPSHFSADHLTPFREADIRFHVDRGLLRNMEKIRILAKIGLEDFSCVSFFDDRITSMNKA